MEGLMADGLISKMEKNSMEEYRFSLQVYRECELLDIRVYYDSGSGKMIPTKKGISVPLDRLDAFLKCLEKVTKKVAKSHAS
jgi:hypothetical protein